jgi:hypothetical protein
VLSAVGWEAAYLNVQARLFAGAKLLSLVKTNPTSPEGATAYAAYANYNSVIVAEDTVQRRIGAFDSGRYLTRWSAARAIQQLLGTAELHLLRLTDNTVAFLSQHNSDLLQAATSPAKQEALVKQFDEQQNAARKQAAGVVLSELWRAGFLADFLKTQLLQEHYHLVLLPDPLDKGISGWKLQCQPTFPFPDLFAEFTPTLSVDNQIKWAPGSPQTVIAMTVPQKGSNHSIATMGGGWPGLAMNFGITPGVVLKCKVDFGQKIQGRPWQATLWSHEIKFEGPND